MTRVLVVDDEPVIRELIMEILAEAGYDVLGAETAAAALELLPDPEISLVVSDIVMPGSTGLEFLASARAVRPSLPVVMVTGAGTHTNLSGALALGADGLVMKPFSHADLQAAVAAALDRARRGESELRARLLTPTLAGALANAIEAREPSLQGHCERLAALGVRLGLELGLSDELIETIRLGAILHDVGKIGIPDRILLKPGPLTDEERAIMRTHPLIGDHVLAPLEDLQRVRPVVRHHHERWDGTGYPDGLAGETIPVAARVVAVADAIEAMSGIRTHRQAMGVDAIAAELRAYSGAQWDARVVDAALALVERGELRFGPGGLVVLSPDEPESPAALRRPVLLVEDDPDHATLAREALEEALGDVAVSHAGDLATARELCAGSAWSLVVVDNKLPDGCGLELVQTLRETAPDVPVLVLTGEGSESVAVEAFRRGAADYVVKSNGYLAELSGRVRALLEAA